RTASASSAVLVVVNWSKAPRLAGGDVGGDGLGRRRPFWRSSSARSCRFSCGESCFRSFFIPPSSMRYEGLHALLHPATPQADDQLLHPKAGRWLPVTPPPLWEGGVQRRLPVPPP